MGPCLIDNSNFGFYSSVDLDLFVFYFRDLQRNIQIIYYKLDPPIDMDNPAKIHWLNKECVATKTTSIATHCNTFDRFFTENESGKLEFY